jgi:hypothetical protein
VLEGLQTINPRVKAIASSGYSDDPIMAHPALYGFKGKLSKPYMQKDFVAVVTEILSADESDV